MKPTERFSSRVDDYVRYRPGYPPQVIDLLIRACGLTRDARVADIGSGTGIFSRLLLERGLAVTGIEPNDPMRRAAEELLRGFDRYTSVNATAEATGLPAGRVDLITVAQAFHWFDHPRCRGEFIHALKPGGHVALIWNNRQTDTTLFLKGYESLLQTFATDYAAVNHTNVTDDAIASFFRPGTCRKHTFANEQQFDFAGLRGRLLSSSYAPQADDARHEPMLAALRELFDAHAHEGSVTFEYVTQVYLGRFIA